MERDISYGGVDIDKEKRRNIQACAGWARNADAKFWTYNSVTRYCTLKSSNSERIEAPNHVSGSGACHDRQDVSNIGKYMTYIPKVTVSYYSKS